MKISKEAGEERELTGFKRDNVMYVKELAKCRDSFENILQ